jgi:hypothetical protein
MSGGVFSMKVEGILSDQRLIEVASLADNPGRAEIQAVTHKFLVGE